VRALSHVPGYALISAGPHTKYAAQVMRAAAAAGVERRVELRGFVDDAALRSLYAGATALVFPSRYEGFGLPPLQALAAGLPVVASDIPVLREVLGECALFAPAGDPESFAAQLQAVISGDVLVRQKRDAGRMHARRFTWQAVAERMVGLYRSVV
jgi:glycosyltransferase involved in cell wall biosynthesis